jgi:hypothetical protein
MPREDLLARSGSQRLPYQMLPLLRAANGPVCIHPADRKYGVLAAGGQGSGKTSILHRLYLSDVRDPNTAPIVMDPKSELARLCLESTPPDCGKRVWYLDLGRPMFGMSPLRLDPARSLPEQASAIADSIVQAVSDTAEGQVFQSSRRYLYHAVIGALALAHEHDGLAMFEDVFGLLLPGRSDLREQAVSACNQYPDLDHTAEFFEHVLPAELANNRSNTYQRLDPPRNKIETILASPALRRFFNHPVDIRLSEIVAARDILIVDANMGAIGEENAQVVMHFIFRLIHSQMQRQIHLPPAERPRVALVLDEGSYLASRNVIKQIATHREAGLDVAMGIQYFSQLGAGAESPSITEEIRKGVINLLQSRLIFRVGEPEDAEAATRVAMAVYQTMISADLESRELMGVSPEESLYLPVWHCIASLIANGARAARFTGQTYPFPKLRGGAWAHHHLSLLEETVGPYPEELPRTYKRTGSSLPNNEHTDADASPVRGSPPEETTTEPPEPENTATRPHPDTKDEQRSATSTEKTTRKQPTASPPADDADGSTASTPTQATPRAPSQLTLDTDSDSSGRVSPLIREAGNVPEIERSRVRSYFATVTLESNPERLFSEQAQQESIRELAAYVDPLTNAGKPEHKEPSGRLPRLYAEDYAILALLDRAGVALPGMIRRAVSPSAAERTMRDRLNKLYTHGLIARRVIRLSHTTPGTLPRLYSLTRYGLQLAQERNPAVIPPDRKFREIEIERAGRAPHDLHVLSWIIELHEQLGRLASDKWVTPRWPQGILRVPQTGNGRARHRVTLSDIPHPKHVAIYDVQSTAFGEIQPDAICEINLPEQKLTFDVLLELDLTGKTPPQEDKLKRYDAFMTTWWTKLRRYEQLRTRPVAVFACRSIEHVERYARAADQILKASLGLTGSPSHERYYPGRDHVFFAVEQDIHNDQPTIFTLPPLPPEIRQALEGTSALSLGRALMLPEQLTRAARLRHTSR